MDSLYESYGHAMKRSASGSPDPTSSLPSKRFRSSSTSVPTTSEEFRTRPTTPDSSGFSQEYRGEPADDQNYLTAFMNASSVAKILGNVLAKRPESADSSSAIGQLYESAKKLSTRKQIVYKLGVVGKAGQGKSSLVNSLLGLKGIAEVGAAGESVTAFPTEYSQKVPHQTAFAQIEVLFMSDEEQSTLLRGLLEQGLLGLENNPEYNENVKTQPKDELERIERESTVAFLTLSKIFGRDLIENVKSCNFTLGNTKRQLTKLVNALKSMDWPVRSRDGVWERTAFSLKDYQQINSQLIRLEVSSFIEVMKTHLDSPLLTSGIVLADIPGLGDTHGLRVKAALEYTKYCDGLIPVGEIKRINSDDIVLETIRKFQRLHQGNEVGGYAPTITVVATCAGDFENVTSLSAEHCTYIERAGFEEARKSYNASKKRSRDEEALAKHRLTALHISARNKLINEKFTECQQMTSNDVPLTIFCVDNRDFFNDAVEGSVLDNAIKESSGILSLRQHFATLPARQRFRAMEDTLSNVLPNFVERLRVWCNPHAAGQIDQGLLDSALLKNNIESAVLTACRNSRQACEGGIDLMKVSKSERNASECRRLLSQVMSDQVDGLTYNTIKAFCRRDGKFKPKNGKAVDWNEEYVHIFAEFILKVWPNIEQQILGHFNGLVSEVNDSIYVFIKASQSAAYPATFIAGLQKQRSHLEHEIDNAIPQLKKALDIMRGDLTEYGPDSYVAEEMAAFYQNCEMTHGKGARRNCQTILSEGTAGKSTRTYLYARMSKRLSRDLDQEVSTVEERLKDSVNGMIRDIESDLDTIYKSGESVEIFQQDSEFQAKLTEALHSGTVQLRMDESLTYAARREAKKRGYIRNGNDQALEL